MVAGLRSSREDAARGDPAGLDADLTDLAFWARPPAERMAAFARLREQDRPVFYAEQRVPLPTLVPVYVTYLTAMPDGSSIAYYDDVYGRDAARLAVAANGGAGAAGATLGKR